MFKADRLAAVFAQLRAHEVERTAAVTQSLTGGEWIYLDRRTAVLTVRAQLVESFEATAFALPVSNLILDEVERGSTAKVGDWKHRLEDCLKAGAFAFFR